MAFPLSPGLFLPAGQDMPVKEVIDILFRQGGIKGSFITNRNPGLALAQAKAGLQFHLTGQPVFR